MGYSPERSAIEHYATVSSIKLPTPDYVRGFIPDLREFVDPTSARAKQATHGIGHVIRGLIIGARIFRKFSSENPRLMVPVQSMLEAYAIHDSRVSCWNNYDNHGPRAVEWFEQSGRSLRYNDRWGMIRLLVAHHSDKLGEENGGCQALSMRQRMILNLFQDVDASDLSRPGSGVAIRDITLRTELAKNFNLPLVAEALRLTADAIHTGDPVKDHIKAAVQLGLLIEPM